MVKSKEFLIVLKDGEEHVHTLDFETTVDHIVSAMNLTKGIVIPKLIGNAFIPKDDIVRIEARFKTSLKPKEFLIELSKAFVEHRSDICEIIDAYLEKNENHISEYKEHRFIKGTIPVTGMRIEYDTLTTHISYEDQNNEWIECENYAYYDN